MCAAAVAAPVFSTRTEIRPESTTVSAKTVSPTPLSAGTASPVRRCWSMAAAPSAMRPSTGMVCPAERLTRSPISTA